MPTKSDLKKTQNTTFQVWWNDKYLSTDGKFGPLYRIYRELHRAGVDLGHIDTLCQLFEIGDSITLALNVSRTPRKRKHVRTRPASTEISDLHLNEALALEEKFEESRKSILVALSEADGKLHWMAQSFTQSPLMPALLKFHLLDFLLGQWRLSKRGSKSDSWGSFFLLLTTEYLKRKGSKANRVYYREANDLLHACRISRGLDPKFPSKSKPGRTAKARNKIQSKSTAAKRIEKLKKLHLGWEDAVDPILLQLEPEKSREAQKYRASIQGFTKRWISEKPLTQQFLRELERRGIPTPAS